MEDVFEQMKTKVIDLFICGLWNVLLMLKLISNIIADMGPELLPQIFWTG